MTTKEKDRPGTVIEVFATSVHKRPDARAILTFFNKHFPGLTANFDLYDCDRIFRIAGTGIDSNKVIAFFNDRGHQCRLLSE